MRQVIYSILLQSHSYRTHHAYWSDSLFLSFLLRMPSHPTISFLPKLQEQCMEEEGKVQKHWFPLLTPASFKLWKIG